MTEPRDPSKPSNDLVREVIRPLRPLPPPTPPGDPADALQEMMEVLSAMSGVGDSPKARAWELLCATARRAPVEETDLKRVIDLADKFEELWEARQKLREMNAAEIDSVRHR